MRVSPAPHPAPHPAQADASQLDVLHALLGRAPLVVQHYLDAFIFPEAMHFQQTKLSASGQVRKRSLLV